MSLIAFYNGEFIGVADGEYYRVITAAFLHTQWWHIGVQHVRAVGARSDPGGGARPVRFTALYLLSALGGSAVSYLGRGPGQPSLGASGAVFGLFGALLVVGRRLRCDIRAVVVPAASTWCSGSPSRASTGGHTSAA